MWITALIVFLSLVALVFLAILVVPLFLPRSYAIEKTIVVNASPEVCFDKVADLNQYSTWNPWSQMEPDASKKISGDPKTIGHRYEWEGKKIGSGSLTVKSLDSPKSAEIALEFLRPWRSKALDRWTFEGQGNQTKITWKNGGPLGYPMPRLMGPFISKTLSQQFEQGLGNIKKLCESK